MNDEHPVYKSVNLDGLKLERTPIVIPSGMHYRPSIGLHFATIMILFALMVGANLVAHWLVRCM